MSLKNFIRKLFLNTNKLVLTRFVNITSLNRDNRIIVSGTSSIIASGVNFLITIITVPLTLKFLGAERYGIWMTFNSIILFGNFLDFGFSNAVINLISESYGNEDNDSAAKIFTNAFWSLTFISIVFGLIFFIIIRDINWLNFFQLSSQEAINEVGPAATIFAIGFLINLPLSIIQKTNIGYQKDYINNTWKIFGSILVLVAILCNVFLETNLIWLSFSITLASLLASVGNTFYFFRNNSKKISLKFKYINIYTFKTLVKMGFLYFLLQISTSLAYQSDNIVLAYFLGVEQVSHYAVPQKLFVLVTTLIGLINYPLWPAYGEAYARKDINWIKRTFKKSLIFSFILNLIFAIIIFIFGKDIIYIWSGNLILTSTLLVISLCVWNIIFSISNPLAMLLNGMGLLKAQVMPAIVMGVINIVISILLVKTIGLAGVVIGSIFSQVFCIMIPLGIYLKRKLDSYSGDVLVDNELI